MRDAEQLLRHTAIIGASGSGKTVLAKCMVEDLRLAGLPVVAIDTQGDLASMGKAAPDNPEGDRIAQGVRLWLPGLEHRINPMTLDPGRAADLTLQVASLSCIRARNALAAYLQDNPTDDLPSLSDALSSGVLEEAPYSDMVTKGQSRKLARALKGALVESVGGNLYTGGVDLDVPAMMRGGMNVVCAWHLPPDQQQTLVAYVAGEVYRAMYARSEPGLNCLFVLDECAPYMPPVRKTPAKWALVMLMRQARKYGVSLLLATQSIGDLDIKAASNVGTWSFGRVVARRDLDKVRTILDASGNRELADRLPGQEGGEFVSVFEGDAYRVKSRWLHTDHRALSIEEARDHRKRGTP